MMRKAATAWVLLFAALAGCETQDRTFDTTAVSRPVRPPHLGLQTIRPEPTEPEKPLPIPAEKPSDETLLASRTDLDPERLIGLSLVETEALLGEPALQDERPPAKVWTYNAQSCVLSIFFYADISTKDFRALTYEIRNGGAVTQGEASDTGDQTATQPRNEESELVDRQCLAELIKEHAT